MRPVNTGGFRKGPPPAQPAPQVPPHLPPSSGAQNQRNPNPPGRRPVAAPAPPPNLPGRGTPAVPPRSRPAAPPSHGGAPPAHAAPSWAPPASSAKYLIPATSVTREIIRQATLQGVPPAIALATAKEESGFNQEARSSAGAIGIMQLMAPTAAGLGVNPLDWRQNIEGGIRYLKGQYNKYHSWHTALEAYNGGPGGVGGSPETHYADTVLSIAQQIGGSDFAGLPAGNTGTAMVSAPLMGGMDVTSPYGPRGAEYHYGVDLAASQGDPIHAMIGGKIALVGPTSGGGNTVVVQDRTGRYWWYFHMQYNSGDTLGLKVGDKVKAGAQIGNVGTTGMSTGPHLDIHLDVGSLSAPKWADPTAIVQQAFRVGWDKTGTVHFTDPGTTDQQGGPLQQPVGDAGTSSSASGGSTADLRVGQDISSELQAPGGNSVVGPAYTPAGDIGTWMDLLNSGITSPETRALAMRSLQAQAPTLAQMYAGGQAQSAPPAPMPFIGGSGQ